MPCERINCAQCLTVLALKNDAPGVTQFLSNVDKSKPFDPYVVIPSDALPTLIVEKCLRPKDYSEVKTYLITDSAEQHLVFQEVITEHPITKNGYEYHIFPFYTIIQGCIWLSPNIFSSIIGAKLVDPLEVHEEVTTSYLLDYNHEWYWAETKRNAVTMFTSMHRSAFQRHLMDLLDENNVNATLPSFSVSSIYPEGHPNKEWWKLENLHNRRWEDGKSVFGFLVQNRWEHGYNRELSTLVEFRHCIMMPLIARGLDVNRHILEFYSWNPFTRSTYTSMLGELIRNGLTNFNTSSKVSLITIVVFETGGRYKRPTRHWAKVRLLLHLLYKLGASFQETSEQNETERCMIRLTGKHFRPEVPIHPIVDNMINLSPYHIYDALTQTHDELALFQQQRRNPLQLVDFARISIRQTVGGQHFMEKVDQLPLPSRIKSFVKADFTEQLNRKVFSTIILHNTLISFQLSRLVPNLPP